MKKLKIVDKKLFKDFITFSERQIDCFDYDHFHVVFLELTKKMKEEESLWLTILYMAYYNEAAAVLAFSVTKPCQQIPEKYLQLPISKMRRNLRGGLIAKHIASFNALVKPYGSIKKFLTKDFVGEPKQDWKTVQQTLNTVWGNGRWSVFTTVDMLNKVNKFDIESTDIMNAGSSGPVNGIERLFGIIDRKDISDLNEKAQYLLKLLNQKVKTRPYYAGDGIDFGMLESILCNFDSLKKRDYYVGRDIDRSLGLLQKTTAKCEKLGIDTKPLKKCWQVRKKVFAEEFLGEVNGWAGDEPEYAREFYARFGLVNNHKEIIELLQSKVGIRKFLK